MYNGHKYDAEKRYPNNMIQIVEAKDELLKIKQAINETNCPTRAYGPSNKKR